ncbi:MAG: YfjI family protein [Magnetospirillum sp.]|nr:YfjI family protein [Magnetospirillum sp.]
MSAASIAEAAIRRATGEMPWGEPEPLTADLGPEPYPADAMPAAIRAAVEEVQGFVKAPLPMVASSALAALSIAGQAHVDVERAAKLDGPTSLFLLPIADSGERKSTLDSFFIKPIREWERQESARLDPEVDAHRAALGAWNAKRDGVKEAIKAAAKAGKDTTPAEADLHDLERAKPTAPRVPKLLRMDDTPENLAHLLATQWPSAAVVSSEAGLVLGSHGMGRDSIMRNLAQLNVLWDGGALTIGRRTSESFTVRGARLTVALQIQEPTLRAFFDGSKGLARGTGFLARFLMCWPVSTQGTRRFTEAPTSWPALSAFHQRIEALLNAPIPMGDDGALTPAMLTLSPEAKNVWVTFHDGIEEELGAGGELVDVRDVASKTADNAARLAALFHVFEHGVGGQIQPEGMTAGARIAAWHLSEARRFFGEIALPGPLSDAVRLERFLLDWCRRNRGNAVPRRDVQREGPLRDGSRLDAAMVELADANRARPVVDGRRKLLEINPAILGDVQ